MINKETVLIVDDSEDTREILQRNLVDWGFKTYSADSVSRAVEILGREAVDLVITDVVMPEQDGFELLRHVRENYKGMEVLVVTGFPHIEDAVRAVKKGAEEYLTKPFTNDEVEAAVQRAMAKVRSRRAMQAQPLVDNNRGLIGDSKPMRELRKAIEKAARSSATILLTGESGTGKEVVARAIHYSSPRAAAPFIPVNCGAIPEQLIESELFGHVKGAFTGAAGARAGLFQSAAKGTILMDEISEAGMPMQVKLLRAIQEKEVTMLGSNKSQKVDVRLIAATNKDLFGLVEKGLFREDLYYRLNVIHIQLPNLRDRGDDLRLLIGHFAKKAATEFDRSVPAFSDAALNVLCNYHWPGNVRELENVLQRLVAMNDGDTIDIPDLPELMRFSALRRESGFVTLAEMERDYITKVLDYVDNNKTKAADILGINRKTLREKLKRFDS